MYAFRARFLVPRLRWSIAVVKRASRATALRARTVRARATARRARVALGTVVVNPSNSYCIAHFIMNQDYEWVGGSSELAE